MGQEGRRHDLPPRWDGAPIVWEPWVVGELFLCGDHMQYRRCAQCGSKQTPAVVHGMRHIPLPPDVTPIGQARLQPREMRAALLLQRCRDCLHDTVWDCWTNEWWDLDDSDYSDEGSFSTD